MDRQNQQLEEILENEISEVEYLIQMTSLKVEEKETFNFSPKYYIIVIRERTEAIEKIDKKLNGIRGKELEQIKELTRNLIDKYDKQEQMAFVIAMEKAIQEIKVENIT